MNRIIRSFLLGLAALGFFAPPLAPAAQPTPLWLERFGLEPWETVFDQDGDGFTAGAEFELGTDPLDADSRPFWVARREQGVSVFLANTPGVQYRFQQSFDLAAWEPLSDLPGPEGGAVELSYGPDIPHAFFRLGGDGLPDTDSDGLLDFEEFTISGTDPSRADTDGDGLTDGEEVLVRRSDPNFASLAGRATLRGRVVLDEDRDPETREHPGLAGWVVFLDLDRDGEPGVFEPQARTDAGGEFVFDEVDPGAYRVCLDRQPAWTQIFPSPNPAASPDGYPDRAVSYVDSGLGPIAGPFGRKADLLPGARLIGGVEPEPVELSVILGPPPPPPLVAPVGTWSHVDWLTLPQDCEVVVAFEDEEIIDGPGPDLVVYNQQQGGEQAGLYLGSSEANLSLVGTITEAEDLVLDFAGLAIPQPVRFLKLRGLDLAGSFPGFEVYGFEALNYRPRISSHYEITVTGGEVVEGLDFGVAGEDRHPRVFVHPTPTEIRSGDTLHVEVMATDDFGIREVTLAANGNPIALDADLQGTVSVGAGGRLELTAQVIDTAGQAADTSRLLIVRNADGTLPDFSGLGISGQTGTGGPLIQVLSPAVGAILDRSTPLVATISATTQPVASWRVHYALAETVNPLALGDNDPDYMLLAEGSGPVFGGLLGTLPGETLPPGAYLIRIAATDINGTTAFQGFVIGVGIDPLEIRPEIVLSAPENDATLSFLTDVVGSIRTRQELREWSAEIAPLSEVDLQNLDGAAVSWTRIAEGIEPVEGGTLFQFDPTLLPNDTYVLRTSAWNKNGLGWAEPLVINVTGAAKLGNYAVEFVDLELPLAGIPIQVKRVYNSLNAARPGDFGYGWSMALEDADIRETIPQTGTGFRSTPFRVGTRVYLNAPDGRRVGFTFQPEIARVSLLGPAWRAVFVPDPGVSYRLATPEGDSAFLTVEPGTGQATLFFIAMPWNPDTYILQDKAGMRYTYGQREGLIEIEDSSGNVVTFAPDAIQHSGGPSVQIARDPQGRIVSLADPDGRQWAYSYDANGDLRQVTYPGGGIARFAYAADREHMLESFEDPVAQPSQRIEYDAQGRVTAIIDAAGNRREQSFDPGAFSGALTDARGNVTQLVYDARGNILRRIDPLGGVTTFDYNDSRHPDRVTATVDPRGFRTTFVYDTRGNQLEVNGPLRRSGAVFTYDEQDRLVRAVYGATATETLEYDTAGRLARFKDQLQEWELRYTDEGRLAAALDAAGGMTRLEYDTALALPSRIIAADGSTWHFQYNSRGQVTEATDPTGARTRFEYDALGRPVREIDAEGGETQIEYDDLFPTLPRARTDRLGRTTRYTYDNLGRLLAILGPDLATTRFEYDADGNRTAVIDPLGNRTEFAYDALSRLVEEILPAGHRRQHRYDAAGNRIETIDGNGRRRSFVYDALNRMLEERWHNPVDDTLERSIRFDSNNLGHLQWVADPDATLSFGLNYTRAWLPINTRTTYPGLPERLLGYAYDAAGRLIQWGGGVVGHLQARSTRDPAGLLRIVGVDLGRDKRWRLEFWRNPRGQLAELRRFNDLNGTISAGRTQYPDIDARGWLTRIEHLDAQGQVLPDTAMSFLRDAEGGVTALSAGGDTRALTYDAAGQLKEVTRNGASIETYAYDLNGNRLASHRHPTYAYAGANRLATAGDWILDYDGEGNLTLKSNAVSGAVFRYAWDHRNRLTHVARTQPGSPGTETITEYRYDPLDRRIAVTRNGATTWTYYDAEKPIADYLDAETEPAVIYFHGEGIDELHAIWRRDDGLFWTLTDHLGSIRHVLDTNLLEVARFNYDAYGNVVSATGSRPDVAGRFAFAGREWDAETGLYYHRARHYDPDLGRFISPDPLGFAAGDANLYRYVRNDPVRYRDPSGRLAVFETALLVQQILVPSVDPLLRIGCRSYYLYDGIAGTFWWSRYFDFFYEGDKCSN